MSPNMTGDGSRHLSITLKESDQLKRECREGGMIEKKMQLTAFCGAKKTHFKISGIYASPFQTLYSALTTPEKLGNYVICDTLNLFLKRIADIYNK